MIFSQPHYGAGNSWQPEWTQQSLVALSSQSLYNSVSGSASAVDRHNDLIWAGLSNGFINSYRGSTLQKYSSFAAHTQSVLSILSLDASSILSMDSKTIRISSKGGLQRFGLNAEPSQYFAAATRSSADVILAVNSEINSQSELLILNLSVGIPLKLSVLGGEEIQMIKPCKQFLAVGYQNGLISLVDFRSSHQTNSVMSFQTFPCGLNSFDAKGDYIVSCGFSRPPVEMFSSLGTGPPRERDNLVYDSQLHLFDIRMNRNMGQIHFPRGPSMIRFHPRLTATVMAVTSGQQFSVFDAQTSLQSVVYPQYQIETVDPITSFDLSSTGEVAVFTDGLGLLHLWSDRPPGNYRVNDTMQPLDCPSPSTALPAISVFHSPFGGVGMIPTVEEVSGVSATATSATIQNTPQVKPFSCIPLPLMPENSGPLLSDWPPSDYPLANPIDLSVQQFKSVDFRQHGIVLYAPNSSHRRRNCDAASRLRPSVLSLSSSSSSSSSSSLTLASKPTGASSFFNSQQLPGGGRGRGSGRGRELEGLSIGFPSLPSMNLPSSASSPIVEAVAALRKNPSSLLSPSLAETDTPSAPTSASQRREETVSVVSLDGFFKGSLKPISIFCDQQQTFLQQFLKLSQTSSHQGQLQSVPKSLSADGTPTIEWIKPDIKYRRHLSPSASSFTCNSFSSETYPLAGLSSITPEAYCNSVLQLLYSIEPLRQWLKSHLCRQECCISCELAFLFHMMQLRSASSRICHTTNLFRVLKNLPKAAASKLFHYHNLPYRSIAPVGIGSGGSGGSLGEGGGSRGGGRSGGISTVSNISASSVLSSTGMITSPHQSLISSLSADLIHFLLLKVQEEVVANSFFPVYHSQPQLPSTSLHLIEQLFGIVSLSTVVCSFCNTVYDSSLKCTISLPFQFSSYQETGQMTGTSFVRQMQSGMFSSSLLQKKCERCRKQLHEDRRIVSLPQVLIVAVQNIDLHLWSTSNIQIPAVLHPTEVIASEFRPQHFDPSPFNLYGCIFQILDPSKQSKDPTPHFVSHLLNPFVSAEGGGTGASGFVFNDFHVFPETLGSQSFCDRSWKVPSLVVFVRANFSSLQQSLQQKQPEVQPITKEVFLFGSNGKPLVADNQKAKALLDGLPRRGEMVALDAEFVGLSGSPIVTTNHLHKSQKSIRMGVGRITVIQDLSDREMLLREAQFNPRMVKSQALIDSFVVAREPVATYLTEYSGIRPGDLDPITSPHRTETLKMIYIRLRHLIDEGCVFVGHGVEKDFQMINIHVPEEQIIDTAQLFRLPHERLIRLQFLSSYFLHQQIQSKSHCSLEDSTMTLVLYYKYLHLQRTASLSQVLSQLYQFGNRTNWQLEAEESLDTVSSRPLVL